MPTHLKRILTAVLAITLAVQSSLASPPILHRQDNTASNPSPRGQGPEIQFGHCYTIKDKNGEPLGHQPSAWNYLRFGAGTKPARFKVCQNLGQCKSPNTDYQVLLNRARFWLFDVEGNYYSPRGDFVAANSPPFGSNRNLYPAGGDYRYYVDFWGENDCSRPDARPLGQCPVKLRIDNLRDDKGLVIQDGYLKAAASGDDVVVVTFEDAKCPDE
ncbi:hypothetical protein MHUMG1_01415 [Metarhizium humberi]|uniref:Uncharacterized protein n=1 Tax=Metarhizium humberi TaxID=2596975 RepID=A0A9P8SA54_9HYPO|nr:hypothetical protein MHUMG1_01415 [Metarhizium humberi]